MPTVVYGAFYFKVVRLRFFLFLYSIVFRVLNNGATQLCKNLNIYNVINNKKYGSFFKDFLNYIYIAQHWILRE